MMSREWGMMSLAAVPVIEAVCLLAVRKAESERIKNCCIGIMALGTNAAAVVTALMRKPSDPTELGVAAVIIAVIVHLAIFFTLCGLILKMKR